MDEKMKSTNPEHDSTELKTDQLKGVSGGDTWQMYFDVQKYRCPKDNGELEYHCKKEYHFPFALRRTISWVCKSCGASYAPYYKELIKVG